MWKWIGIDWVIPEWFEEKLNFFRIHDDWVIVAWEMLPFQASKIEQSAKWWQGKVTEIDDGARS